MGCLYQILQTEDKDAYQSTIPALIEMAKFGMCVSRTVLLKAHCLQTMPGENYC